MILRTLALDTSWGSLTVAGGSRAGEGTLILLPQLRLGLEGGRPHRALAPMNTVLVSHGHMDHIGGLPLTIQRLGNPVIFTAPLTAGIVAPCRCAHKASRSRKS